MRCVRKVKRNVKEQKKAEINRKEGTEKNKMAFFNTFYVPSSEVHQSF